LPFSRCIGNRRMKKPDDFGLNDPQRQKVRREAQRLLAKADAIGRFPTPVKDVLDVARLEVVEENLGNLSLLARLRNGADGSLKKALSKVLGIFDVRARLIFIDRTVKLVKQTFITFHETGHFFLPWQRDAYKVIEDCPKTLDPEIAENFDREANIFASEVLFQLDGFSDEARDHHFGVNIPLNLGRRYGASAYSSIRQYVIKNNRPCAVLVLNPPEVDVQFGFHLTLRRCLTSQSFPSQVGLVEWSERYTPSHPLWDLIPTGKRKMSSPRTITLTNTGGVRHACMAEAFSTGFQVFILILAEKALGSTIIIPTLPRKSVSIQFS
jgi:hypothetical protein